MFSTPNTSELDIPPTLAEVVIKIDHVALAVPDLDAAVAWYTRCLGFRVVERRLTRGTSTAMVSAVLAAGNVLVVLVQGTEPASQVSRFIADFGPGIQHLALAVSDIEAALERVVEAGGAAATPIIEDTGIRQVFLRRDPGSGIRIELIERRGGSFTEGSVARLFRTFEEHGLY